MYLNIIVKKVKADKQSNNPDSTKLKMGKN